MNTLLLPSAVSTGGLNGCSLGEVLGFLNSFDSQPTGTEFLRWVTSINLTKALSYCLQIWRKKRTFPSLISLVSRFDFFIIIFSWTWSKPNLSFRDCIIQWQQCKSFKIVEICILIPALWFTISAFYTLLFWALIFSCVQQDYKAIFLCWL